MLDVLACGHLSKQAERGTIPTSSLMTRGSAKLISFWAKESTRVLSKRWRASNKEARAEMVLNAAEVAYMALAREMKGRQKLYDTHADM